MTRAGARFSRVEPRRRARAFVLGLLAELPRKNCWTIAEHAGERTPDGMQHLLSRARWDADGVRDDVRSYVVEQLGDPGAVLGDRQPVIDLAGDGKDLHRDMVGPGAQETDAMKVIGRLITGSLVPLRHLGRCPVRWCRLLLVATDAARRVVAQRVVALVVLSGSAGPLGASRRARA